MHEIDVRVTGMTCEHCERRVTAEIVGIAGVRDATADATTGLVRIGSDRIIEVEALRAAVEEAGYELADD